MEGREQHIQAVESSSTHSTIAVEQQISAAPFLTLGESNISKEQEGSAPYMKQGESSSSIKKQHISQAVSRNQFLPEQQQGIVAIFQPYKIRLSNCQNY